MDYEPKNSHSHSWYDEGHELSAVNSYSNSDLAEAAGERAHQSVSLACRMSTPPDTTSAMRNRFNSFTKRGTETGSGGVDVEVQIEKTSTVDYSPVILERTNGNYGLSGTRDRVLPKGLEGHLENGTGGSLRV